MELVTRPVPGFPPVYSPGAVDAILAATACQPFLLQVLCSVVVEELNRRRWQEGHPLVAKEVAAVLPKAAERAENYFLDVWNSQVPSPAKLLIRQLDHQGKVPAVDQLTKTSSKRCSPSNATIFWHGVRMDSVSSCRSSPSTSVPGSRWV